MYYIFHDYFSVFLIVVACVAFVRVAWAERAESFSVDMSNVCALYINI